MFRACRIFKAILKRDRLVAQLPSAAEILPGSLARAEGHQVFVCRLVIRATECGTSACAGNSPRMEGVSGELLRIVGSSPRRISLISGFVAVDRLLAHNQWFKQQVQPGIDQIARGEFIEDEEMDARVERMRRP